MTKAQLMEYVGRNVRVTFTDGDWREGRLGFTKDFSAEYGFRNPNHFTIGNLDFKVSHIKKCVCV